jgi:uncharacterized protein
MCRPLCHQVVHFIRFQVFFFSVFMLTGCNSIFYHPTQTQYYQIEDFKTKPELISFNNSVGTHLSGWYFKTNQVRKKGVIIQFHGNAQNISSHFSFLHWIIPHGYDLFIFDYSGYGLSKGRSTVENLRQDAIAAFQYVEKKIKKNQIPIILFAQSLGVAVLTDAFSYFQNKNFIKAIILDSGFYSYQEIARDKLNQFWLFWPFQHFAYLLITDSHSPEKHFQKFSPIPTLVIHGKKDRVVPFNHGEKIYELLKQKKTFWKIENGSHTSAMPGHAGLYREKLLKYLDDI